MTQPRVQQLHQSGATDGQVLTWDNTAGIWIPDTPTAASSLNSLSDVDTTGVADGDALIYDSGTSTWLPGTSGGGGGAAGIDDPATFNSEWGATALVPDLEFNGSTVSLPSGWSWVNQGSSSYEEFADHGYLYASSSGGSTNGGDTHRMLVRSIPAASAFRAFFNVPDIGGEADAYTRWAIVLRESSSGKYLIFGPATDTTNAWAIHLSEWSATNTFASNLMVKNPLPDGARYVQVRKVSSSSWSFYTSTKGRIWTPWSSGYDPAAFSGGSVTFDQIGMLFSVNDASFTGGTDVQLGWFRIR